MITVRFGFRIQTAEFFNNAGTKVWQTEVNDYESTIDISRLAKGDYIIRLNTARGKITKHLIVN